MKQESLLKVHKRLKKYPTKHEVLFRRKLIEWGFKFRCQKIISGFIVDFFLPQFDLVIEIDGSNHHKRWGLVRDRMRDAVLKNAGHSVLHIRNSDVEIYQKEDLVRFADQRVLVPEDNTYHAEYFRSLG